ncbi:MAG: hypothetical protein K0R65_1414 [Crocinitomicaceae bacterium]|jgi:hypothetical protein|nr:hypothetical protein [Crocinitomicaceae bacterium]
MKKSGLLLLLLALCSFSQQLNAQRLFNGVKKISNARGTFWLGWGYNRSYYTESDIRFRDKTYDFTLFNSTARDQKLPLGDHFAAETMFKTQFDFKAGYYFRNKYAVSLGYTRFNYIFNDGNQVLLDGKIDTTLSTPWRGTQNNEEIITNRSDFHYANQGMNFLHASIQRTDKLYQSRNKMAAFSTSYGLSLGAILSNNTFLFAGTLNENKHSLSGYGLAAFASARLEFFRHIYLQGQLTGGSINQFKVQTAANNPDSWAKHRFWYGQRSITLGFFYYFKPGNGCNDCPVW